MCLLIVGKIKREEKKLRVFCFTFGACCWFFAGKIEVGESYPIKREHVTSLRLNSSQQQFPISFFHNLLILYFQASPSLLLPHLIFFICHLKKSKRIIAPLLIDKKRLFFSHNYFYYCMFLENCSVIDEKELGIQKQKLFHCITKDGTKLSEGVGVFSG